METKKENIQFSPGIPRRLPWNVKWLEFRLHGNWFLFRVRHSVVVKLPQFRRNSSSCACLCYAAATVWSPFHRQLSSQLKLVCLLTAVAWIFRGEFQLTLYRSIALLELYIFCFERSKIGRSVRPKIHAECDEIAIPKSQIWMLNDVKSNLIEIRADCRTVRSCWFFVFPLRGYTWEI